MSEKKGNKSYSLSSLKSEYKKIYWPNKAETLNVTVIVLLIAFFVALYILAFDNILSYALSTLTSILKRFLGGV